MQSRSVFFTPNLDILELESVCTSGGVYIEIDQTGAKLIVRLFPNIDWIVRKLIFGTRHINIRIAKMREGT